MGNRGLTKALCALMISAAGLLYTADADADHTSESEVTQTYSESDLEKAARKLVASFSPEGAKDYYSNGENVEHRKVVSRDYTVNNQEIELSLIYAKTDHLFPDELLVRRKNADGSFHVYGLVVMNGSIGPSMVNAYTVSIGDDPTCRRSNPPPSYCPRQIPLTSGTDAPEGWKREAEDILLNLAGRV